MDFKSAVDLIIKDINELKNIVDGFKNYPNIPSLQIEIAKSKCRNAVEILELLKSIPVETIVREAETKETLPTTDQSSETIGEERAKETPNGNFSDSVEKEKEIEPENRAATKVSLTTVSETVGEESKKKETIQTKIIAEELIETFEKEEYFDIEDEPVTPEAPSTEKIEPIKTEKKKEKPEAAIYAERFSSNPNSVYDRLSGTKQQSDSSKGKRSSNLFELIGLNDQFLFIREIFNGDSDLYNTAVNRLNNAKTFTEANEIIFDYIDDEEDEAYKTLVDLVKRKFSVDG